MKNFAQLYNTLQSSSDDVRSIKALVDYFQKAEDTDKVWCIALLMGKRPTRIVATSTLRSWAEAKADLPVWLVESTYKQVGDLVETLTKIVPKPSKIGPSGMLTTWIELIMGLKGQPDDTVLLDVSDHWDRLGLEERFVYNKLITGGFRFMIPQKIIGTALAQFLDLDIHAVIHKLMRTWDPLDISFVELLLQDDPIYSNSKPYPYYLAETVIDPEEELGEASEWLAEYKWDGVRCQIVKRSGQGYVWTRGSELITHLLPEIIDLESISHDFVLDGDLVVFNEAIMPQDVIQKRISKKKVTKKLLKQWPVMFIAYDLLELDGEDQRQRPLSERRKRLEELVKEVDQKVLSLSNLITFDSWSDLNEIRTVAREKSATGLMLKSINGVYKKGRATSEWFKWNLAPFTIEAVMLYAHRSPIRGSGFSEFTFAVIDETIPIGEKRLVVITKASGDLDGDELKEIAKFIKANTVEKFGPVFSITPVLVFEISFLDITFSTRNKSGLSIKNPQIVRWVRDKSPTEIGSIKDLKARIKN